MQVPNSPNDVDEPHFSQTLVQPTERHICGRASLDIRALVLLTEAKCPCTPQYLASKDTNQGSDGCVLGSFLDYIVMEKLKE
ncbi:hypothetical protein ASPBRDRAFT_302469 [Aspergillus brasiliensis CBS 101740]|uniref:Uncharacterized protein n=1 Tax=Aspergillus brasiliensis (strain CBS 101740 / IMI 381727 / IBT 21946) TaxID=767769 RepID=A0A1L9UA15_ASPBC|nr:hypothetical protein ASPBRDRAFT_302469 [Aspergillus brasiliensis CBS 101740]